MSKTLNLEKYYEKRGLKSSKKKSHSDYVTSSDVLADKSLELKSYQEIYEKNISEFFSRIDGYEGFFSTQQVESIDYDKFEDHVFFDSAVEKVNYAYEKILNEYPYDGSKHEVDQFIKSIDGYTKYILDNKVKKSLGYLRFNGESCVKVTDKNGHLFNDYKKEIKFGVLNPSTKNFSFDFWLYPEAASNSNDSKYIIAQKLENDDSGLAKNGYTIYLNSFSEDSCDINLVICINSSNIETSFSIKLNEFQHINFSIKSIITSDIQTKSIFAYLNGKRVTNQTVTLNNLDFTTNEFVNQLFLIGKGKNHKLNESDPDTAKGFVGLIDEFRFYIDDKRNIKDILKEKNLNIHAKDSLCLYLKFNESNENHNNNNLVLDHSGKKIHGLITNYNNANLSSQDISLLRSKFNNVSTPLKYEEIKENPVLFSLLSLEGKNNLLEKAVSYDLENPNSFWKLLPKNIFIEGSDFDNVNETYVSKRISESSKVLGTGKSISQTLVKLITIWARFFDQLKVYIDAFSSISSVDYSDINSNKKIDGVILPLALKSVGVNFREILPYPLIDKLDGKNLTHEEIISDVSIRQIQNNLWKRFLINSKDYLRNKGTHSSIKSVFNSFGLEADRFIRIRENTGSNRLNIDNQFSSNTQNLKQIDFSKRDNFFLGSNPTYNETSCEVENQYFFYTSNFKRSMPSTIDLQEDWTIESYISFPTRNINRYKNKQSLMRIDLDPVNNLYNHPLVNIVFERINNERKSGDLTCYINSSESISVITIEDYPIMDGQTSYISIKKKKNIVNNTYEYHLVASKIGYESYTGQYKEVIFSTASNIAQDDKDARIALGSYEYKDTGNKAQDSSIETTFEGCIFNIRGYSKFISKEDALIKTKDVMSLGLKKEEGIDLIDSLKINISLKNEISKMEFDDNSKSYLLYSFINKKHNSLLSNKKINCFLKIGNLSKDKNIPFAYKKINNLEQNYEIDFPTNYNKIFINSFKENINKNLYSNNNLSFLPEVPPEFKYYNDMRVSIDFSAVNFLNKEMSKIITANDFFTNALSVSSDLFETEYKSLESARENYFERLQGEIDILILYQTYKYFDNILEELLYDAIPSKVNYLGFNFVYESHIFERNKYQYKMSDSRLPTRSQGSIYQDYSLNTEDYRSLESLNLNSIEIRKAR